MLWEMTRDRARVRIIGAARVESDHKIDDAAFVELFDGLRFGYAQAKREADDCGADDAHHCAPRPSI
jgi:hypothetical protein